MEGRTFHGQLRLDNRGFFMMTQTAGPQVRVDLPNLLHGRFTDAPIELERGVVLVDGRAIAAEAIESADTRRLRLRHHQRGELAIDMDRVAELVFAPAGSPAAPLGAGVLLRNGDFIEGTFRSLSDGRVRINSVLFGPMSMNAATEVARVVLAPRPAPQRGETQPADYLVRTTDGSAFRAASISIEGLNLIVEDSLLGRFQVPGPQLLEIRYIGGRLQPLLALPPPQQLHNVTLLPGPGETTTLRGEPAGAAIHMSSGAEATWPLPGRYRALLCRAGVPEQVLPTGRVRFIVQIDGRPVYTSPYVSSVDEPLDIIVRLEGAASLTLRVDGGGAFNPPGLWADPQLLRE